jgi:hypothetical protein
LVKAIKYENEQGFVTKTVSFAFEGLDLVVELAGGDLMTAVI